MSGPVDTPGLSGCGEEGAAAGAGLGLGLGEGDAGGGVGLGDGGVVGDGAGGVGAGVGDAGGKTVEPLPFASVPAVPEPSTLCANAGAIGDKTKDASKMPTITLRARSFTSASTTGFAGYFFMRQKVAVIQLATLRKTKRPRGRRRRKSGTMPGKCRPFIEREILCVAG
jgi:hypothetical protein